MLHLRNILKDSGKKLFTFYPRDALLKLLYNVWGTSGWEPLEVRSPIHQTEYETFKEGYLVTWVKVDKDLTKIR